MTTTNGNNTLPKKDTKRRVTLFINPLILKQAKAQAVLEDTTLTVLVETALVAYLPKKIVIERPV